MSAPALVLLLGASVACNAPPGTVVARILTTGGDGKPISYTISGSVSQYFRIRPSGIIVVGPNGIAASACGKTNDVTVTATQN